MFAEAALQTLDDVALSFFYAGFDVAHQGHDQVLADHQDQMDYFDQVQYRVHQLVHPDDHQHQQDHDQVQNDLEWYDRLNRQDHDQVAKQEFDQCVHLSMAPYYAVPND